MENSEEKEKKSICKKNIFVKDEEGIKQKKLEFFEQD